MIKQQSIDEVRQRMDVYDVVSKQVALKKKGAGYEGLCPFHNEKSPSFRVDIPRQIYKCFGCGKAGDAITFLMQHDKKTFVEAIELLAQQYNITLEYDQAKQQESEEKKTERQTMLELISLAHRKYEDLLFSLPDEAAAIEYMHGRGYSRDRMKQWSIGVAPDDWKFLTTPFINMGKHDPSVKCGLVYQRDGKSWDFYRNRIIIPIHDQNGILVGLAGRLIPGNAEDDKKQAKYMNPCESIIYQKKKIWYGLWQAQKAIREAGYVYITEGYMDVQSMQDAGMVNTIASSGTEIDELQVKMLKRYTEHACIFYDGDDPGTDKAMKQINLFLQHGFKTSVVQLENGQDPDEFIREYSFTKENIEV